MFPCLLLSMGLLIGQAEAPLAEDSPAETSPTTATEEPDQLPESLKQCLRGTSFDRFLDDKNIRISGWTEASFTASSASHQQLPMGFNSRANEFLLQQNWLRVERPVEMAGQSRGFGFRFDTILPGSDYRFTMARGLFDGQLIADQGQPARYGVDPVQFYAQAYFPEIGKGLDVKLGRFFSPYGVESIDSTQSPLASRAYTFIYNPFTHTGLLTTLKISETITIQNGLVTGSDIFIDKAASPTYVGGIKWSRPDGKESLQLAVILGSGRYDEQEQFNNPQVVDLVYNRQLNEKLSYAVDALLGFQSQVPDIGSASWFGVVQYLTYKISPEVSSTARLEFFEDVDGNRTGSKGLYSALTGGLAIQARKNILLRPEIRYDNQHESQPFEGRSQLFTATLDVIVSW